MGRAQTMRTKKIGVLICLLALQLAATSSIADWRNEDGEENRSWYLGAGVGITELDPSTGSTGYRVSDERDTGFKLFGGFDFSERLTVEGFYTDLGSAQLSGSLPSLPDGEIDYSTLGVSALWYFIRNGDNKGKDLRKGLQVYAHGGLSFLSNSSSVAFSQDNSVQVQYGAGVEYGFNNGIALRAGLDLYDRDAGMAFVSVIKRFGVKHKRKVVAEPEPVAEPVVEPTPEPVVIVPVVLDTDKDGVIDGDDQCADSPENIKVDSKGCSIIAVEIEGVNFEPKSFDLTVESKGILDAAVAVIKVNPELQIEVQAHTDYKGSEKVNMKLSEQRAQSVKTYLVSQGVDEAQLVAKGYGESQPIADNKTEEGRAKNRRVELKIINDEVKPIDDELLNNEKLDNEKPLPDVNEVEKNEIEKSDDESILDEGEVIDNELSSSLNELEATVKKSGNK